MSETPTRGELLLKLRKEHSASVEKAQALFKEQRQMQQAICQFTSSEPRTIPQIAAQIGKPTHEVLWFVSAMKKYGIITEAGMCGDYPLYQRTKENQA